MKLYDNKSHFKVNRNHMKWWMLKYRYFCLLSIHKIMTTNYMKIFVPHQGSSHGSSLCRGTPVENYCSRKIKQRKNKKEKKLRLYTSNLSIHFVPLLYRLRSGYTSMGKNSLINQKSTLNLVICQAFKKHTAKINTWTWKTIRLLKDFKNMMKDYCKKT